EGDRRRAHRYAAAHPRRHPGARRRGAPVERRGQWRAAATDAGQSVKALRTSRPYRGLEELDCPFHDRTVVVTRCGRICFGRRKIDLSTVFAGQKIGIREVADRIWLVSFMHYDLGFFDHETGRVGSAENPFAAKLLPMSPELTVTQVPETDQEGMVGPVGLEPTTKGFTRSAVSDGSGLSLHPRPRRRTLGREGAGCSSLSLRALSMAPPSALIELSGSL